LIAEAAAARRPRGAVGHITRPARAVVVIGSSAVKHAAERALGLKVTGAEYGIEAAHEHLLPVL
jgi:hypothetical protein